MDAWCVATNGCGAHACEELVADEFKREQARAVRVSGPAGLAGLAALKFKEAASFEEVACE